MHKKDARKRKKLVNQIRHHRVMADGRVLTPDGRETLLGNLAPVKQIPMLPWKRVLVFPTVEKQITISTVGENAWFYNLLKETSEKNHDLVGFTPVKSLDAEGFDDIAVGSIGIAVQIREIETTADEKVNIQLKGICRYETTGFLPSAANHFSVNIKWFEDNREADSLVRPHFVKLLQIFERLSKAAGVQMHDYFDLSKNVNYDFTAAQYLSFIFIDGFRGWFTEEEKCELLRLRSTAHRLKKINERAKTELPDMERRFKKQQKNK
ncbi:hypothetical protein BH10ACI1_BH10ACI1_16690 [soil metagenome]